MKKIIGIAAALILLAGCTTDQQVYGTIAGAAVGAAVGASLTRPADVVYVEQRPWHHKHYQAPDRQYVPRAHYPTSRSPYHQRRYYR